MQQAAQSVQQAVGGPANVAVVTPALRRRNIATAFALIGFVGGVYVWTTSKMRTVCRGWLRVQIACARLARGS